MANLTQRQEKFVRALIAGKSQRQAYKEAYNAANMKDKTIDERASVLLKNSKVKARYNELQNKLEEKMLDNLSKIDNELIKKIEKYKREEETVIEFIEKAILKALPVESLTEEEMKEINRRKHINSTTRYAVLERAGFKCQACGAKPTKENDVELNIDHIIPFSLGGSNDINNLQVLCKSCNTSKNNKYIINHNESWCSNE